MNDLLTRLRTALQDRYAVDRQVGEGGMATVYLAQDLKHRRAVALKVLRPELAATLGQDRFLLEIQLAAGLQHPHIVPVYDSGAADGFLYYIMPFVEGESLRDRLEREGRLPVAESVRLAQEMASALGYAHAHGIVHRDVKPENVMLSGGHAVVTDFGIARAVDAAGGLAGPGVQRVTAITGLGLAIGTPAYMSPEQATASHDIDGRSDQYALACVLYEMLAGEQAFTGTTVQSVITKSITGPRPRVRLKRKSVAPALDAAIRRGLAKEPAERWPDMPAFGEAIGRAAAEAPAAGRRSVLLFAAATLALLAGGGWLLSARGTPGPVAEAAQRIAVLPFATTGPGVRYMGEGMVDLLSTNLDGVGGIRTVDPRLVLQRWKRRAGDAAAAGADLDGALAVGREVDAGAVLLGSVVALGSRVRLSADLYARSGERLAQAQVDGPADSVLTLVDGLSVALLRDVWRSHEPLPSLRAGALATTSVDAMREYLRGEQFYRRSTFDSATAAFGRAVELDSMFALAQYRLATSLGWIGNYGDPKARHASDMAVRYSDRLPARERMLLVGYQLFQRMDRAAVDTMRRYVAQNPRDADGWYLLGEAQFHTNGVDPADPATLRAPFDSVLALDPSLTPAAIHPVEVALVQRDRTGFERYLRLLREAGADDEARLVAAAGTAVWGPPAARDSAIGTLFRSVQGGFVTAAHTAVLRDPGLAPDSALADARRLVAGFPPGGNARARADFLYTQLLGAFGRYEAAATRSDSATAGAGGLDVGPLLAPILSGTATPAVRRVLLSHLDRRPADTPFVAWLRAALALGAGDVPAARVALARVRVDTTKVEPQMLHIMAATQGWVTMAAGDTAAGLATMRRELRALGGYNNWGYMVMPLQFELALALAARPETRDEGMRRLAYGFDNWSGMYPWSQYALGKAAVAAGRRKEAAAAYGEVVRLWSTADPVLQPRVAEARRALQELTAEPR